MTPARKKPKVASPSKIATKRGIVEAKALRSANKPAGLLSHSQQDLPNKTGFLDLLADLRNEIYRLTLGENELIRIRPRHSQAHPGPYFLTRYPVKAMSWQEPPVLRVCKTVRIEASKLYYGSNDFDVSLTFKDFSLLTEWLKALIAMCGVRPFKHFNLYIVTPRWVDLAHIHPFVRLLFETEIQLAGRALDPSKRPHWFNLGRCEFQKLDTVYHFQDAYSGALQSTIEELVELGKTARTEDWHEDMLDVEFGVLVEEKQSSGQCAKSMKDTKARQKLQKTMAKRLAA